MVGTKLQKRKGLGFWERFSTMPLGIPYGKISGDTSLELMAVFLFTCIALKRQEVKRELYKLHVIHFFF